MTELREKLNNIVEEKQAKIIPENLKVGVEAFGVQGNFTSDATATSEDIAKDKTAYVNGEKITGTLEIGASEYNASVITTIKAGRAEFSSSLGSTIYMTDFGTNFGNSIISLNGNFEIEGNSAYCSFAYCTNLKSISKLNVSNVTNMINMFFNCSSLETLPELNTVSAVQMSAMFSGCSSLKKAPTLNTAKVTHMSNMFKGCTNLVDVPIYDTSKIVQYFQNTFSGCPNLSNESLNNIMQMCINAELYKNRGENLTLAYVGLTSDQATRCQGLSNYQAFLDAGWQTGY